MIYTYNANEIESFAEEKNATEYYPNGLKVSSTDNPLFFPYEHTYQVGSQQIVALCSNSIAVGTGQTGAAPLYVFCKDGVYALMVDSSGEMAYTNARVIARDVCNNGKSVTPIDNGVVFTTDRGIMCIAGDQVEEIGQPLEGDILQYNDINSKYYNKIASNAFRLEKLANLNIEDMAAKTNFLDYLKKCIINYNHNERELIVSNPDYEYSYVLDRNGRWGRRCFTADQYVNNYPTSYRLKDNKLYQVDEQSDDDNSIFAMSRELKLDSIGFKNSQRLVARGFFETRHGDSVVDTHNMNARKETINVTDGYYSVTNKEITLGSFELDTDGVLMSTNPLCYQMTIPLTDFDLDSSSAKFVVKNSTHGDKVIVESKLIRDRFDKSKLLLYFPDGEYNVKQGSNTLVVLLSANITNIEDVETITKIGNKVIAEHALNDSNNAYLIGANSSVPCEFTLGATDIKKISISLQTIGITTMIDQQIELHVQVKDNHGNELYHTSEGYDLEYMEETDVTFDDIELNNISHTVGTKYTLNVYAVCQTPDGVYYNADQSTLCLYNKPSILALGVKSNFSTKYEIPNQHYLGIYAFGSYDGRKWACIGHNEKSGSFTDIGCLVERIDCKFFRFVLAGQLTKESRLDYFEISNKPSKLSNKIR